MLRQKFIDRLRNKYQTGGTDWKKTASLAIKGIGAGARFAGSKLLGPVSLALGANKAYALPVYDESGINRFTGNWMGSNKPLPNINMANANRQISAAMAPKINQTGGMYEEPRQYHEGGPDTVPWLDPDSNEGVPHMQLSHHQGGNTGNTGSEYGPNSSNPGGPGMEWGVGYGAGPGMLGGWGVKTPYGSLGMLPEKPKNWGDALGLVAGPLAGATGLASKGISAGKKLLGKLFQEGGMYNQMQQYKKGGKKPKKGEFGSGRDVYTDEEWANMSSADKSRAFGKIGGGRPGNYTGIKISDPDWYSEQILSHYESPDRFEEGGMALPGGVMESIPGSDAVVFKGATHEQGGIYPDAQTEVEGGGIASDGTLLEGETMDQVNMAKTGGKRDYFFSSHLKKGGKSFADMHKDILRDGGNQQEIDWLAQMQENAAGRDPNQVAKLGGVMKYQNGSFLERDQVGPVATVIPEEEELEVYDEYGNLTADLVEGDYSQLAGNKSLTEEDKKQLKNEKDPSKIKEFFANLFKKKELTDEEIYKRSLRRKTPAGAYIGGAAQLLPAAYAFLHKQPEAQQIDYTPGFTSPIIAERGKAAKLDRVNYNVDRARNAGDMRAINKYIETSGGGPANVINKMMAYSKKQQGDAAISAAETKANIGIANTEAQLAQQMELSNLQRSQQASTATAQLSQQEAARADEVEAINAAARQKRIEDMEYMKYQGLTAAAQGIAGIVGDSLTYKAQERLAQVLGSEGIYERENIVNFLMKEGMTAKEAKKKARELYNKFNPKEDEDTAV